VNLYYAKLLGRTKDDRSVFAESAGQWVCMLNPQPAANDEVKGEEAAP
jgi:hypothetical protein